ncbi:MAG: hypothetical protein ACJ0SL_05145 [Candidatus Rariloculaceae bacterium]
MLKLFTQVATQLFGIRRLLWTLGVGSIMAFIGVLFLADGAIDGSYALAALSLLLWSLWALALAYAFIEPAPVIDPAARLRTRFAVRLKRIWLWVLALLMAGLMIVAVIMTMRTVGLVLDG